ncbi:MAG: capsid protein [Rhizobiaceae bacterium]|nr:capsid protein [Rhizobiaceae bacterium]
MTSIAITPSARTLHAELLRLCARIGYSPPRSA